ncbi:MAG: T9SS type A sorting domain-containing protein [Bacteroidetes bacterium]|nr:T9SS type A sorting domain-containing protein [Bacteroidota bacterium]
MKKIIYIILLAYSINANAQIALEHSYDTASTFKSGSPALSDQLELVHFEVSGDRYVKINRHGEKISIYDLNHVLLKTIDLSGFPGSPNLYILYLSESLFDTDPGIEFMYTSDQTSTPPYIYTGIYNDDGTLIFSDTAIAEILINFPSQQYPIYNTTQGTKMILSYKGSTLSSFKAKVFSLPGTLSAGIQEGNAALMQAQGAISNLYPNPSTGKVTLQYELPKGEREGEIILYNTQGAEVKRYKVDDTFKDLLLDNTQLPAGTYFYQLQTSKGSVGTKKMVVIK